MGKDEQLQLILEDEDLVRRVKEWISRREEIQQASVAASNYSFGLENFLVSLPDNDFDQMIQDLGIERAFSRDQSSSQDHNSGLASTSTSARDVPTELNDNDVDALHTAHTINASSLEINPQAPKVKGSYAASARAAASSTRYAVFNVYDVEEEELKLPLTANWNLRQPSVEVSDQSPSSSSDESSSIRTSRASTEEPASDHATEHDASALPEGNPSQSVPPAGNNYQRHYPHLNDARQSTSFAGHNPPQLPATLQAAAQIAADQVQNQDSQQLLDRDHELARLCASLQAENKNLKRSSRCLGQQYEQLNWKYIQLEEIIKNLELELKEKENNNEENHRIIKYFHKQMIERKNELQILKKEMEIMRNIQKKHVHERKEFYEWADKENQKQTQVCEQMKKQTKVLEKVKDNVHAERHEKQDLKEKLKQKSVESDNLQAENQLLKEENLMLRSKLETLEEEMEEIMRRQREAIELIQDEYICREAYFNERINQEIQKQMELFENLKKLAQKHGFLKSLAGLNLERENDNNFSSL